MVKAPVQWQSVVMVFAITLSFLFAACQKQGITRFPHAQHLSELQCGTPGQEACLSCANCHAPSQKGRLNKLPNEEMCGRCHSGELTKMSQVVRSQPERPYGEISFNHDQHLKMTEIKGQCVSCHAGVVVEGQGAIPPMSQCFSCHEHENQWKSATCSPCHQQKDLEQTLPKTFLRHDQHFLLHHRSEAVTQQPLCQSCHQQSDCQGCHDLSLALSMEQRAIESTVTKQIHRGDFMVRHAIEARSEPAKCISCHAPSDCTSCHLERGVSGLASGSRNPHPPGWVGGNPNSRDSHGRSARRDLLSCVGCHEAGPATNCIRCHKVGGHGGDPHPSGWTSVREPSSSMCRYCHEGL